MAETKNLRAPRRAAPAVDRWILDVETEETLEVEFDPYAGRFGGDHADYDLDDSDFDRAGGHGLFGF